jgi:hypothetical protein
MVISAEAKDFQLYTIFFTAQKSCIQFNFKLHAIPVPRQNCILLKILNSSQHCIDTCREDEGFIKEEEKPLPTNDLQRKVGWPPRPLGHPASFWAPYDMHTAS